MENEKSPDFNALTRHSSSSTSTTATASNNNPPPYPMWAESKFLSQLRKRKRLIKILVGVILALLAVGLILFFIIRHAKTKARGIESNKYQRHDQSPAPAPPPPPSEPSSPLPPPSDSGPSPPPPPSDPVPLVEKKKEKKPSTVASNRKKTKKTDNSKIINYNLMVNDEPEGESPQTGDETINQIFNYKEFKGLSGKQIKKLIKEKKKQMKQKSKEPRKPVKKATKRKKRDKSCSELLSFWDQLELLPGLGGETDLTFKKCQHYEKQYKVPDQIDPATIKSLKDKEPSNIQRSYTRNGNMPQISIIAQWETLQYVYKRITRHLGAEYEQRWEFIMDLPLNGKVARSFARCAQLRLEHELGVLDLGGRSLLNAFLRLRCHRFHDMRQSDDMSAFNAYFASLHEDFRGGSRGGNVDRWRKTIWDHTPIVFEEPVVEIEKLALGSSENLPVLVKTLRACDPQIAATSVDRNTIGRAPHSLEYAMLGSWSWKEFAPKVVYELVFGSDHCDDFRLVEIRCSAIPTWHIYYQGKRLDTLPVAIPESAPPRGIVQRGGLERRTLPVGVHIVSVLQSTNGFVGVIDNNGQKHFPTGFVQKLHTWPVSCPNAAFELRRGSNLLQIFNNGIPPDMNGDADDEDRGDDDED